MQKKSEVIVIGAGAVGICTAYYLHEAGLKVTVLEKGEVCSGCSYGNAGLVVPSHFIPLAAPGVISKGLKWMFNPESPFYIKPRLSFGLLSWLRRFARACNARHVQKAMPLLRDLSLASRELYKELAKLEGADFGFCTKGLLMLYKSDKGKAECHELAEAAARLGLASRELNDGEISQLDPNIRTDAKAVYFSQDAHIEPNRFVQFLSRYIQKRGVAIHTGTAAIGFHTAGAAVKAVRTTRGEFAADTVVLAGGSWSPKILRDLRLALPMQPAKGYSITFQNVEPMPEIPMLCTEAKVAVTPFGDRLRYGGTLELAGLDLTINQRRVNAILKAVPEYLPEMACNTLDGAEVWSGLRPCTPDGLPYLGRFPKWPNLVAATGHAMIGISLAPITGKLVAEIVLEQKPSIDIQALSVERFS